MPWGRIGAADRRNPGDNNGQQETTNLEASGRFAAIDLGRETAGLGFHTAEATGPVRLFSTSFKAGPAGGRLGRPPAA
jgi:hypothetical protein